MGNTNNWSKVSLRSKLFLLVSSFTFFSIGCTLKSERNIGCVVVVSLSSDGTYAISSHSDGQLALWNIPKKTKEIISSDANIYSAYFIKHKDFFMFQNSKSNDIIIEDVDKNIISTWPLNYASYGEVITSDLKHYFASDKMWDLYTGHGTSKKLLKRGFDTDGFDSNGKLLSLEVSSDDTFLLSTGSASPDVDVLPIKQEAIGISFGGFRGSSYSYLSGVVKWDIHDLKPASKFSGNVYKAFATISPSCKFIISGDEESFGFVWNALSGKRAFRLDDLLSGHPVDPKNLKGKWDASGLIHPPKGFKTEYNTYSDAILAIKFIDTHGHYLRFTTYVPYAILYSIDSPQPIKYISLGNDPAPQVTGYMAANTIDTAPESKILIMSQAETGGIIVYKFDETSLSLNKIWASA